MKNEIRILVGNIGAGKTTYCTELVNRGFLIISKEAIRYMLGGGKYIFDLALEKQVDEIAKNAVICLTYAGYDIVIDETNMTRLERGDYLHYVRGDYKKIAIIFPRVSKKESVKRRLSANHGDTPKEVWEEVWKRKDNEYEIPREVEGFDEIVRF